MVRLLSSLFIVMTLLVSCTTQEVMPEGKPLSRVNALAISNKPLVLTQETLFAWSKPIMFKGNEAVKHKERAPEVSQAIESLFAEKGHQLTLLSSETNYLLVAYVLLEGHDQLQEGTESREHKDLLFGLDPGMRASGDYGVGTLLVGIKDAKTNELMWRGAVQILTSSDVTDEQRKVRLQNVVGVLFKTAFSNQ